MKIQQFDLEKILEEFIEPIPAAVMARVIYEAIVEISEQLDVPEKQVARWLDAVIPKIMKKLIEGEE